MLPSGPETGPPKIKCSHHPVVSQEKVQLTDEIVWTSSFSSSAHVFTSSFSFAAPAEDKLLSASALPVAVMCPPKRTSCPNEQQGG